MANTYSKKYFPNLDAPRFFAFAVVFLEHIVFTSNSAIRSSSLFQFYNNHFSTIGVVGWDFYMVLSGFLITWIILEEYSFTSKFNLFYFWLKRCLRIWPLYFLMILAGFGLAWASEQFFGNKVNGVPPLPWLLTFTLNFYIVKHGHQFLFFLVFFWSISVEEQCYVVWGIVLKWVKKALVPLCIFLIAVSVLFRFFTLHEPLNIYFNSLSWVGNFAAGSLLACFCIRNKEAVERFSTIPRWVTGAVYLLFLVNFAFYNRIYASGIMTVIERLPAILFFSFLIFEQSFCRNPIFQLGKIPLLNYLGRISYGLFCYHGLVILLYEKTTQNISGINNPYSVFLFNPVIIFILTVCIASLSYKYIEKPIMMWRQTIVNKVES